MLRNLTMIKEKILVVDDESLIRWSLKQELTRTGYDVSLAESGEEALKLLEQKMPEVVLLDIMLPDISGIDLLDKMKEIDSEIPVIMITGAGTIETAVSAMKKCAYDYITKPFKLEEVTKSIKNALETTKLKREVAYLRKNQKEKIGFDNIIGVSTAMHEVFEQANQIAGTEATTVLLEGESGTGKDMIAKAIHQQSSRLNEPFVEINCTAIPDSLLESELIGYEKGAFTDAKRRKIGLFEEGNRGTIFFDEIGDIKPEMQVKLLRIIETKKFRRLGGVREIEVDIRMIAATNRDLAVAVKEGNFREDLYYRLKIFPIYLPPLRERKDDVLPLAKYFINYFNKEAKRHIKGLSKEAKNFLLNYPWPGNVRELKNVIERAVILVGKDEILKEHLPREIVKGNFSSENQANQFLLPPEGILLEEVERDFIRQAIDNAGGNQIRAAKLLGLSRDTLRYRMKKFEFL